MLNVSNCDGIELDGGHQTALAMRGDHVTAFMYQNDAVICGKNGEGKSRVFNGAEQNESSDKEHRPMKENLRSVDFYYFD
jgi:hypothetical protein